MLDIFLVELMVGMARIFFILLALVDMVEGTNLLTLSLPAESTWGLGL